MQELRRQIEQLNADIERAEQEYDLNKAAELKYGRLPALQKELEAEEEKGGGTQKNPQDSLLRDKVTDEEIARIVERWTGIPVARLMEGEREKVLHLPELLHQRVIGQDEAVQRVSEAILRSRAGIQDPNRPWAPSCSWAPPVWVRPSWPRPWPNACLTTSAAWCALI